MMRKTVLVTDLDNTLFDWVKIWYDPFAAMLDVLERVSGLDRETLISDFKTVFTRHGTTEYVFAIQELPSLIERYPGQDLTALFASAIAAFRSERRRVLRLYSGVEDTLRRLKQLGCILVGYTESSAFYTHYRMRRLGLDLLLDTIYSPPDHEIPGNIDLERLRTKAPDQYGLRHTTHHCTPKGEAKPNPDILVQIIQRTGAENDDCVYVGDSLMKDVLMAQQAGVADVWARYGFSADRPEYQLLRAVTHWPKPEVEKEKVITEQLVSPTFTLRESFAEILSIFDFGAFLGRRQSVGV